MDEEALKRTIQSADTRFLLVSSKNPKNTYKILWFTLSSSPPRHCKVDVLIPGLLEIPRIPQEHVVLHSHATFKLPVMPLFPLLLLKLRGWDDHRSARAAHLRKKTHDDIKDIDEVLAMAVARQERASTWVPESLVASASARVREYVALNHNESRTKVEVTPRRISEWVAIGVSNQAILQEDVQERVRFLQERHNQKAAARAARYARRAEKEPSTVQSVAGTASTGNTATAPRSTATGFNIAAPTQRNQLSGVSVPPLKAKRPGKKDWYKWLTPEERDERMERRRTQKKLREAKRVGTMAPEQAVEMRELRNQEREKKKEVKTRMRLQSL